MLQAEAERERARVEHNNNNLRTQCNRFNPIESRYGSPKETYVGISHRPFNILGQILIESVAMVDGGG